MQELENRNPAISTNKMNQIRAAQTGVSARMLIESERAHWVSEKAIATNDAIRTALNKPEIGEATTQLRQVLDARNAPQDPLLKAQAYIRNGNLSAAANILNGQQNQGMSPDLYAYTNLLLSLAPYPAYVYQTNQQQQQQLQAMASNPAHAASVKAQSLLREVFGSALVLPVHPPQGTRRADFDQEDELAFGGDVELIGVYPNPVHDHLTVDYSFEQSGEFRLFDGTGRIIKTIQLMPGQATHSITMRELAGGIYYYQITDGSRLVKADRLVITE